MCDVFYVLRYLLNIFIFNGKEPKEWYVSLCNKSVLSRFYCCSSFFYSLVGLSIIIYHKQLQYYDKTFWWILFGFVLFIQGFLSYMGDIYMWGIESNWKTLDIYSASFLTFISGPVIIYRGFMGYSSYPYYIVIIWFIFVLWAIYCKYMSTRVLKLNMCCDYLFWHGLWHCLPLYGVMIILWLSFK
jgi:hypothetical protein